jgi:hypothetical protein
MRRKIDGGGFRDFEFYPVSGFNGRNSAREKKVGHCTGRSKTLGQHVNKLLSRSPIYHGLNPTTK